ncbi:ABC transporter permease [Ilumatobacter sp.]|uniref:ABC transporter permease n=1 Tax=Ilumatobacter sp. TaxID=1967498 RepID=UPI003B51C371
MTTWAFFLLLGVGTGALYAAFATSIVITYRGSGVVNLAVGALAMIPALTYAELRTSGDLVLPVVVVPHRHPLGDPLDFLPAAGIGVAVGLAVAAVVHPLVIRRLRAAPPVSAIVATIGLTLVLQGLAARNFGNVTVRTPRVLPDGVVSLLDRPFPVDRLWMAATVIVIASAAVVVYRVTRFGLATRAAFLNEKGAILLGLEPARLGFRNWMVAAAISAVVGVLASSLGGVGPFTFALFVVPALAAALAGRLRSIPISVGAALAIGGFEAIAVHLVARRQVPTFLLGGISSLVPFLVIVVMLFAFGSTLPTRGASAIAAPLPPAGRSGAWWWWVGAIGVAAVALASDDSRVRFATTQTLFVTTLLLSIVVLTGFVGQVSLAQPSFAGLAAFTLSRVDTALVFPVAPLTAIAVTTVIGTLVSVPGLRVRGVQFAIVTLAVAVVFDDLLFRSPTFVGGDGIARVTSPVLFGVDLGIAGGGQFPQRRFGFAVLAVTVVCALALEAVRRGSLGRRFRAVRSNEGAAAAGGIDVVRTKIVGAAIASAVAGTAGVVFAYRSTTFTGAGLGAQEGLALLALAYLGGIGSTAGAVIGGLLAPSGVLIVVLLGGGSTIEQYLLTGSALVVVAVRYPYGLVGAAEALRASRRRNPHAGVSDDEPVDADAPELVFVPVEADRR